MEYYDIVDHFVLVESTKSHTGKPKDLIFQENKDKYAQYLDKVIHVVVEDLPDYKQDDIWLAENYQRNCILRGLYNNAQVGDKIIVSDCDELWDTDAFLANKDQIEPFSFVLVLYHYWVNCKLNAEWGGPFKGGWAGPCCATLGTFQFPQELRNFGRHAINPVDLGGWHYSFMGGAERIMRKVENIAESHMIIDSVGDVDLIKHRMAHGEDLWGRTEEYTKRQLLDLTLPDAYKPKKLDEFLKLYPEFYRDPNTV